MTVITSSPTQFGKLLEIQRAALDQSIVQTIHQDQSGSILRNIREIVHAQLKASPEKLNVEQLEQIKELTKSQKKTEKIQEDTKDLLEDQKQFNEAIQKVADGVKAFRSVGDRLKDSLGSLKGSFSGTSLMKSFNVMGMFDKKIARNEFVSNQKSLGSTKSDAELRSDFSVRNKTKVEMDRNDRKIADLKRRNPGLSDDQLAKAGEGKSLFAERSRLNTAFAATDQSSQLIGKTPSAAQQEQNNAVNTSEEENEKAIVEQQQSDLLKQIADNTSGKTAKATSSGGDSGADLGILGGIGKGLSSLGGGLEGLGKGAGAGIKGFLMGLAEGLAALAKPQVLIGLAAVTLALMGIGKALEMAAPFVEAFGDAVAKVFGTIFEGIRDIIREVTDSIIKLSEIDGSNLLGVGAGLVAVAAGLATFGGATAVAGVGNLVGGLLSKVTGQKTPIEQIMELGDKGPNIEKAGIGVEKLGVGLKMFSSVDPDKIKAIAALPTEKIAAMGAAMGNANAVYNKSGENQGASMANQGGGAGGTAVIAPTTNVKNTTSQVVKLPVRNQDQTMSRYLRSRYA